MTDKAWGSYTGNGGIQTIECDFPPELVIIKGGSNYGAFFVETAWSARTNTWGPTLSRKRAVVPEDTGFTVGDAVEVNQAGVQYEWYALASNGNESFEIQAWSGNGKNPRQIDFQTQKTPKCAIIKRDTAEPPVTGRVLGSTYGTNLSPNGSATQGATVGAFVNGYGVGTMSLDANSKVNQMAGALGEATIGWAIFGGSDLDVITWTGDGVAGRTIAGGVGNLSAVLIWDELGTIPIRMKTVNMAANEVRILTNQGPTSNEISLSGANMVIGSDVTLNTTGKKYFAIVIGPSNSAPVRQTTQVPRMLAGSGRKVVYLPGREIASRIEFGTDDSLNITGAMSQMFIGRLAYWSPNFVVTNGGQLMAILLRHGGDPSTIGNLSWGLLGHQSADVSQFLAGPMLDPVVTTWHDWKNNPPPEIFTCDRTGLLPPRLGRPFSFIVTHTAAGRVRKYINGKLVKQRDVDMPAASVQRGYTPVLPNIQSTSGHRLSTGAWWDGSAWQHPQRMWMAQARVYTRELTMAEVSQLHAKWARGDAVADVSGFLEDWNADNASGTTLPATVNAANNGTIINGSVVTL